MLGILPGPSGHPYSTTLHVTLGNIENVLDFSSANFSNKNYIYKDYISTGNCISMNVVLNKY